MNQKKFIIDHEIYNKISDYTNKKIITLNPKTYKIHTPRLDITPFKKSDLQNYYKIYQNSSLMKNFSIGTTRNKKEVDALMNFYLNKTEPCYFSIFCNISHDFMGIILLTPRKQKPNELTLGYILKQRFWFNKLAQEATYSVIYCITPYLWSGYDKINATTKPNNLPSIKILENLGFDYQHDIVKFNNPRKLYSLSFDKIHQHHQNIAITHQN